MRINKIKNMDDYLVALEIKLRLEVGESFTRVVTTGWGIDHSEDQEFRELALYVFDHLPGHGGGDWFWPQLEERWGWSDAHEFYHGQCDCDEFSLESKAARYGWDEVHLGHLAKMNPLKSKSHDLFILCGQVEVLFGITHQEREQGRTA